MQSPNAGDSCDMLFPLPDSEKPEFRKSGVTITIDAPPREHRLLKDHNLHP